jgi:alpha-tubulin suppressor-like RCC1 family protein
MGQLGCGKQRQVRLPQRIAVRESEETLREKPNSQVMVGGDNQINHNSEEVRVKSCSAGYGHTAALSEQGELFMWGFNVYGQLGTGDKKTRWFPYKIDRDIIGTALPRMKKIACSSNSTFGIDELGNPYSWGKGFIGHKGKSIEELPRRIEQGTENRYFTNVYCNESSAVLYAPIRVYSISPKCGPAMGGTLISIIGTGFVNSDKLRVRFKYGDLDKEVSC